MKQCVLPVGVHSAIFPVRRGSGSARGGRRSASTHAGSGHWADDGGCLPVRAEGLAGFLANQQQGSTGTVWTTPRQRSRGVVQRSAWFEALAIAPGKPPVGLPGDFGGVAQNLGQIVEGVLSGQLAGVDEAQEHISHVGAVLGLEEQGVLAVMQSFA
jgi:hypothetical protein